MKNLSNNFAGLVKIRFNDRLMSMVFILLFLAMSAGAQVSPVQQKKIDSLFLSWKGGHSPGMELIILHHGRKILDRSFGEANLVSGVPNSSDRPIWVASMSKQFTGLAIALLVIKKKINMDDDIRKYLPELPFTGDTVRISHLVYHSSGMREGFTLTAMSYKQENEYTNTNVLKYLSRQKGRNFRPGDRFEYNNSGYVLLAMIVERVSKMSFPDFTERYIFKPLKMTHSRFVSVFPQDDTTIAMGYSALQENGQMVYRPAFFKGQTYGSSALITSANDLAKWDRIFYEPVFGKEVQRLQMQTGILNNGASIPYAFGLEVDIYKNKKSVTHSGADAGYKSEMLRFPDEEFTVICLANTENAYGLTGKLFSISELFIPFEPTAPIGRKTDEPVSDPDYLTSESLAWMKPLVIADSVSISNAAGVWHSEELDVDYRFFEKDGTLFLKFFDVYDLPLNAYIGDYYVTEFLGTNIIHFVKDARGNAVTMEFSREGIQRLQFRRN